MIIYQLYINEDLVTSYLTQSEAISAAIDHSSTYIDNNQYRIVEFHTSTLNMAEITTWES